MKFLKLFILLVFVVINNLSAQTLTLKTTISNPLQETSGLIYLNGKLITHTDSGGEPALYEMDTTTGIQSRKVFIQNATNIDWEDITMDNNFIYIGDFGNNQGNRTNLRIYKIAKADYLIKDTVMADTLLFNYADQTNFSSQSFTTNFDAEALINLGDSLYIFTKNWGNGKSYIYPISKNPGSYSLTKTDSIDAQGLITGADCDSAQKQILLIGYTFNSSFFIKINNWGNHQFSTGQIARNIIQPTSSIQIEGVAQIDSNRFFISSETFQTTVAELHVLDCRFPTSASQFANNKRITLYPNPSDGNFIMKGANKPQTFIYSMTGLLLWTTQQLQFNLSHLSAGTYFVKIIDDKKLFYKKIQVR